MDFFRTVMIIMMIIPPSNQKYHNHGCIGESRRKYYFNTGFTRFQSNQCETLRFHLAHFTLVYLLLAPSLAARLN